MRFLKLLFAATAATLTLSACSGSAADPFDGKTPEEVAMFILTGFEKNTTVDVPRLGTVKTVTVSEKPLIVDIQMPMGGQVSTPLSITVEDKGDCTFRLDMEDKSPGQRMGDIFITADLSGVTDVKHQKMEAVTFTGAKFQCVKSVRKSCDALETDLEKGNWPRFGLSLYHDSRDTAALEEANKRLGEAVQHLRTKVCKA